jgi:hypothetical protein
MLAGSVICKVPPVGVLLGGSGIYGTVSQRAPQVGVLLRSSQDWDGFNAAIPVLSVSPLAEADHDD